MYTKFIQKFVEMWDTFCLQTFSKYFVYKMYTKICRNMGYILHTNILYTFCIHQFWSTESVHYEHYIYTIRIQNYTECHTNNCMQNGSFISTYFDLFVVHFLVNPCKQLRLETCWLITEGTYQIDGLLDYTLH